MRSLEEMLADVHGMIEANSNEEMYIWQTWHEKHGYSWKQEHGFLVTVGQLMDRPICISVMFVKVKEKLIMFWHATSVLVDYDMIAEWLKENLPDAYHCRSDAMNAHIVMHTL
ncbi:hypothetical protein PHIN3_382 [Sinorhizobium phage phiN3]|uniref:Uncharacterized protein n=1 Tax=Sinorhizobium phage phiN3 TaxID=1647405 RepID=A0A0F6WD07_9CAUD|nr:hypothetical protein AVT40_gp151 [Sinorhizobium phage phiN3]AKF13645.1 hypothetical protein PHIN3_382 [Sinorhizobium phage phiN3]